MLQKLRSRQGTTLTELLVTVILMALLATGISMSVSASASTTAKTMEVSERSMLLDTVSKAIRGELRYARDLTQNADGTVSYFSSKYGQNTELKSVQNADGANRLVVQSVGGIYYLLGSAAYMGQEVEVDVSFHDSAFDVKVTVYTDNWSVQDQFYIYPFS